MGTLRPTIIVRFLLAIVLHKGELLAEDYCGERVALRHLKDFRPRFGFLLRLKLGLIADKQKWEFLGIQIFSMKRLTGSKVFAAKLS